MTDLRHRVDFLTPGQLTPQPQPFPGPVGGTVSGFYARGWAEGRSGSRPAGLGAVRGADTPAAPLLSKWSAGSPGFPSSFQAKPAPRVRQPAGVLRPGSRGSRDSRDSPSPDRAQPASPPPAPPTAPPRQSQVPPLPPYLSRPPFPPTARSPVPVTLLGVYAWSPPRTPLGAREPPGAPARPPRSLAVADGATARAGAAEPRAQLARGRTAPPPTQPGQDSGLRWPVAPSGPEGEEAGGRGGGRPGGPGWGTARPGLQLPREGWRGAAHHSAGDGQDPRAAGRSCPPPPRLGSFLALAKSPERPEVEPPPPPATSHHAYLSFCLPSPALPRYLSSPSSFVSTSPPAFSGSHIRGIIRAEH